MRNMLVDYLAIIAFWWQEGVVNIDWVALSRLVPEVVLVLIFVYFTMERDKRAEAAETARTVLRLEEMRSRDADWRQFLIEERQWRSDAMARIAEEIKQIGKDMAASNALLVQHDSWVRMRTEEIARLITANATKPS